MEGFRQHWTLDNIMIQQEQQANIKKEPLVVNTLADFRRSRGSRNTDGSPPPPTSFLEPNLEEVIKPHIRIEQLPDGTKRVVKQSREPDPTRGLTKEIVEAWIANEIRTLILLNEHNISGVPRLLDSGIGASGRPYLVTEFIPGTTVSDYEAEGGDPKQTVVVRLRALGSGLLVLDEAYGVLKLIHGDSHGNNMLLTPDGRVYVIDWGTAHVEGQPLSSPGGVTRAFVTDLTINRGPQTPPTISQGLGSVGLSIARCIVPEPGEKGMEIYLKPILGEARDHARYARINPNVLGNDHSVAELLDNVTDRASRLGLDRRQIEVLRQVFERALATDTWKQFSDHRQMAELLLSL